MDGVAFRKVSYCLVLYPTTTVSSRTTLNGGLFQGDNVWFDPGLGYSVAGEVVDFDAQSNTVQVTNHEVRPNAFSTILHNSRPLSSGSSVNRR